MYMWGRGTATSPVVKHRASQKGERGRGGASRRRGVVDWGLAFNPLHGLWTPLVMSEQSTPAPEGLGSGRGGLHLKCLSGGGSGLQRIRHGGARP